MSKEPWYECDFEQQCSCSSNFDPEWEWDEEEECWKCPSCGDTQ